MKNSIFNLQTSKRLLAMALATCLAQPTLAQESPSVPDGPSWLVNCDNRNDPQQLVCSMSQSVIVLETGARLITAIVRKGETGPNLAFVLPLGLNFHENIRLSIDENLVASATFFSCDAGGCYAQIDLTEDLNETLMQGEKLLVQLVDTLDQQLALELELDGYATSFALMN